jgi:hypothetical protein
MERIYRTSLSIAASLALAAPRFAQTFVRSVSGPRPTRISGMRRSWCPTMNGDGYKDFARSARQAFNQERGAIYCVSGSFLATGAGSSMLWSARALANQGDLFGTRLADIGDITGDGVARLSSSGNRDTTSPT